MRFSRTIVAAAAAALLLIGYAGAEVYVTSPSTGRVVVLDSTGQVVRSLGDTGGLMQPYSVILDSQRNLIVADWEAGKVLSLSPDGTNGSVVASNIPMPDGLSMGTGGEVYLVSRDNRPLTTGRIGLRVQDDLSLYLH